MADGTKPNEETLAPFVPVIPAIPAPKMGVNGVANRLPPTLAICAATDGKIIGNPHLQLPTINLCAIPRDNYLVGGGLV